jgi:PAS domain-containing protein
MYYRVQRLQVSKCPECGYGFVFQFRDHKDCPTAEYIAERSELCRHCGYKRVLSRVTESGQILFASTAPARFLYDLEAVFDVVRTSSTSSITQPLEVAIDTLPDICLVADDDRRYVEVNRAASEALELAREEIIGRRIDDLFAIAPDISISAAWREFVSTRDQFGTCELLSKGVKFRYRARANILDGLHLSLLRPVK